MILKTHIDFAWPSEITEESFFNIEENIENLLMNMSGFDDLDHAEMFYNKKYRIKIEITDVDGL